MSANTHIKKLSNQLAYCLSRDRFALKKRLERFKQDAEPGLTALNEDILKSVAQYQQRLAGRPVVSLADNLPIAAKVADIVSAVQHHQVVVITGETGSGKTTQLPKILLSMGRGVAGMIGHTQPRRIAARSVATRIAEELQVELGQQVGYKVRFNAKVGENSYIKLMTDGILLTELQQDRYLSSYDTLIIDEAHERSLNIDFILGYLKWLLPRRPDLKVIITSATIDPQRFSAHFKGAPIIEVSGRMYPVETWYRPLLAEDDENHDQDIQTAILEAVNELSHLPVGDILIFLATEREIRETETNLRKQASAGIEILPLYARLNTQQQNKVFEPTRMRRRIILATNIAETSLTVPGVRYVIDTGYARVSRYSYRTKVQRLPIEKISQASCDQRKGRCGRVASGICIRLYSEMDYQTRPVFTEPEILRTNLAAVILQMYTLKLGNMDTFSFIDAPDSRRVADGIKLLTELGGLVDNYLTDLGRQLARIPLDPRLARMILAASERGVLREVLIIASALSIPDPRERPFDYKAAADQKHQQYGDEQSDFMSFLNLWYSFTDQQKHLSQTKLRHFCKTQFLSFTRMREWQDVYHQLVEVVTDLGFRLNQLPAEYAAIHQALLTGLLGHIANKQLDKEYLGARNNKLKIFPGSGLYKKSFPWVMAATLLETDKLYLHTVAAIEPEWIEPLAKHLVTRQYFEPHWERKRGDVVAFERVSLYGLVIEPKRKVSYGLINSHEAREIFIRQALVEGDYETNAQFFKHNRRVIEELLEIEHKIRKHDVLVDNQVIYDFYDQIIPETIYNDRLLMQWLKTANAEQLFLTKEKLIKQDNDNTVNQFPETLKVIDQTLSLAYHFEPGHVMDGVTVTVPQVLLRQLPHEVFEWLVPGLLSEKVVALIKSLPKSLRRYFVPAPYYAEAFLQGAEIYKGNLIQVLSQKLTKMAGVVIPESAWDVNKIPAHLRMNFKVIDLHGQEVAVGRDLSQLINVASLQSAVGTPANQENLPLAKKIMSWNFGDLPKTMEKTAVGVTFTAYTALVDRGDHITIEFFDDKDKADRLMHAGLRRLFMLTAASSVKNIKKYIPHLKEMGLYFARKGTVEQLVEDITVAAVDRAFFGENELVYTEADFLQRKAQAEKNIISVINEMGAWLKATLFTFHIVSSQLTHIKTWDQRTREDISSQINHLIFPGFIAATPYDKLRRLPVYLKGIALRLEKITIDPRKDPILLAEIAPWWQKYLDYIAKHKDDASSALQEYRWLLEEYRISLFAQSLKTQQPVSAKRLEKLWRGV